MSEATIALITSGLRLGIEAARLAQRLLDEGYTIPELEEFKKETQKLQELPLLEELPAKGE